MLAVALFAAYLVGVGFAYAFLDCQDEGWQQALTIIVSCMSWFVVTFAVIMSLGWFLVRLGYKVGCKLENAVTEIFQW
jgi:hypothetical protein